MESLLQFDQPLIIITIIILLILILCISLSCKRIKSSRPRCSPPQPAGAWPLIGHLHLLQNGNMFVHHILSAMADKHGPIFSLRLGFHDTLVISSCQVAKECFTAANDLAFSTRPKSLAMELMAYNQSVVGVAPYGQYWRSVRKFVALHLLSNHRLHMLKHVRFSEIDLLTKGLYRLCMDENGGKGAVLVDLKAKVRDMTTNIITRIIAGGGGGINSEESDRFHHALGELSRLAGLFIISDAIPFLGWLDRLNGNWAKMKKVAKEIDDVLSAWVKEHREKRGNILLDEEEVDLIHVMLSELRDGNLANTGYDDDTIIKSTCMSMILGANDTTSITMTWALCFILNNRDTLRRAQEELDACVGRHRLVEESDIHKLVYLQAIFKETLRLQPTLPLLLPREAMEDCKIAGFDIPAGTRLLVNAWKMHRDSGVWSEPTAFKPERFLTQHKNIDVTGKNFELLPFGCGRRMCPGITFSQQIIHLSLARLLQGFELDTIRGLQVDMTSNAGLTCEKSTPLEVLLTPRISHDLIMNSGV